MTWISRSRDTRIEITKNRRVQGESPIWCDVTSLIRQVRQTTLPQPEGIAYDKGNQQSLVSQNLGQSESIGPELRT